MKKIIVISGKQYSGKDTLAKLLLQYLDGFTRVGIGDAIKIEYGKQKGLSFDEIENLVTSYGEQKFHAKQIFNFVMNGKEIEEMTEGVTAEKIYVTAFLDFKTFKKLSESLDWGTEV